MSKRLVLAGGGHAHMLTLAHLEEFVEKGFKVTVIGPDTHHYYSGMGPGMLGGTYSPDEIRFATRAPVEKKGGKFIRAKVTGIRPVERTLSLSTGETVPYDVLSCNLGSQVPEELVQGAPDDIFPVKPIEGLYRAKQRILALGADKELRIAVVGGGPSAVEVAGNIRRLGQEPGMRQPAITVFAGRSLMPDHPAGVRDRASASLAARSVRVINGQRVQRIQTGQITDAEGTAHAFDLIFIAVGVRPNRIIKESGIPVGPQGGMLVNRYLHSTEYEHIFGGGDCIDFEDRPLDKAGVYAVRQNPVLKHNLMAALTGGQLRPFEPGGKYLLIFNLGNGTGILKKWSVVFGGRLAFFIKDRIDRRFMRTFQAFE
jgi:NADH dehydrogenase FAD-containing subunit